MSSVTGGCGVGGWLGHKGLLAEVEVSSGALPLRFLLVGLFIQRLLLLSVLATGSRSSNLINAISVEEELGRAQSKPTPAKIFLKQVRRRAAPTFQSGLMFYFLRRLVPVRLAPPFCSPGTLVID